MQWHRHLMRMFVVRPTRSTLAACIMQESKNKQSKEDKKLIVDPAITGPNLGQSSADSPCG